MILRISTYLLLVTLLFQFVHPAIGQNCSLTSFAVKEMMDHGNGTCDYELTLSFNISNCNNNSGALDVLVSDGAGTNLYSGTVTNFCTALQTTITITADCGSAIELNTLFYDGPGGSDCDVITAPVTISLPIELLSFDIIEDREDLIFEWVTLSEQNSQAFILQESRNGRDFYDLESVTAAFESSERKIYTLRRPSTSSGLHYWRLRMLDFDDSFVYSPVISKNIRLANFYDINMDNVTGSISILFDKSNAWDTELHIWSNTGQLISKQNLPSGERSFELSMGNLIPGMYYLQLGEWGTEKILISQ